MYFPNRFVGMHWESFSFFYTCVTVRKLSSVETPIQHERANNFTAKNFTLLSCNLFEVRNHEVILSFFVRSSVTCVHLMNMHSIVLFTWKASIMKKKIKNCGNRSPLRMIWNALPVNDTNTHFFLLSSKIFIWNLKMFSKQNTHIFLLHFQN